MMAKPVIGVTPLYDVEQDRIWMRPNYLDAIDAADGIPLILPLTSAQTDIEALAQLCDGFLFTGGPDVHPSLFHEDTMQYCGAINERRDTFEIKLLNAVNKTEKPVFGICRGIQLINVALGGSLYQDIPAQVGGVPIAHNQHPPFDVTVHSVSVEQDSPLAKIIGKKELTVNSMHHQAVKELAPGLKCAAASKDGLTECVYMPGKKFFLAVQWHPEYLWKTHQDEQKIIEAFVNASKD
jgi:putative glutamine amidotransferase